MRRIILGMLALSAVATMAVESASSANKITLKGSDTMVILGQSLAEHYMKAHPGAIIQTNGGGSGVGIAALINGATDICQASRPMKDSEKGKLRDRYSTLGTEIPVAKDGLTVYLNDANAISELTLEQIKDIYTGKITNWKAVGGKDAKIILYSRENNSGTYVFFKDNVLKGADYAPSCQNLTGTATVVQAVSKDANGIGYGGAAYAKGVKELAVKKDASSPAIKPIAANVGDGSYPITRYLYWYTRNAPTGDIKSLVDWTLSAEGQKVVTDVGYFPVK